MEALGVEAVDTRDKLGRGRFFPFDPYKHIIPGQKDPNFWYWNFTYYPEEKVCIIIIFNRIFVIHLLTWIFEKKKLNYR